VRRSMIFVLACAAMLALPIAGASAAKGKSEVKRLATKQCQAERGADKAAFRAAYGRTAMRNCIRQATPEVRSERRGAAAECRDERAEDADAFREAYGNNKNKMNAFGKCVRSKVNAEIREDVGEFKNAAKECRAERSEDADAFRETYGTNAPKGPKAKGAGRNAFGKCVSGKVREADDGDEENGE